MPGLVRSFFVICLSLLLRAPAFAQNLLANPGFEDANVCTEFLARCAPEAWKEANYGRMIYLQNDKGGKVGFCESNDPRMRTYLATELLCPLQAGEQYDISFDLNLRGAEFKPFGIYLSPENLQGRFDADAVRPLLVFTEKNGPKKLKKMDWQRFDGSFAAIGGERFFYLGYFEEPAPGKGNADWIQIIYIDNIKLEPQNRDIRLCPEAAQKRAELYADDWRHMGFPADTVATRDTVPPTDSGIFDVPPPENAEISAPAPAETAPRRDTLVLSGVCFDFNKSTLNSFYAAVTDSLTDKIAARNPGKLLISGHTDNIGSEDFNLKLSLARARTIEQILLEKGIAPEKITCEGLGEAKPVAPNDTEAGRAANRRIEIVLFFND